MPTHIGQCGHKVSAADVTRCRKCWRQRGADLDPAHKVQHVASICGHPVGEIGKKYCQPCYNNRRSAIITGQQLGVEIQPESAPEAIRRLLKSGPKALAELAYAIHETPGATLDRILAMKAAGTNLHEFNGQWSLERQVQQPQERVFEYVSRPDNTFHFGIASDQHLCSRYAREDVLNDLYDAFAKAKVDRVFNAGNWIDGEDEKNRFDLSVHGLEPQVEYLVQHYPQRDGLTTYAVWGEDHEGWFSRRESIDVGRFAEGKMRTAGRQDWIDLGFVEARVDLVNANTGARQTLVVMHPGGGSSYAYSYRSQKIIESLSGGEKPAVLLIGHYHKLNLNVIRNVWTAQCGTCQDQTVFMRKKGLDAHVGGMLMTLEQDPQTGAIFRCVADQRVYYDRAYYNDRWSKTGPVVQAPRFAGGVVPVAVR